MRPTLRFSFRSRWAYLPDQPKGILTTPSSDHLWG